LLNYVSKSEQGQLRAIRDAVLAGTIPPEISFWDAARNQGFTVKLRYRGHSGESKQDDHHVTADLVETVCTQPGPSTIILVAGDGDYGPALDKALNRGWRVEVFFVENRGLSTALTERAHRVVKFHPDSMQLLRPKK
jgi:uncharacterized LabA/DUF88 family protein